jgi:hypothetical protein
VYETAPETAPEGSNDPRVSVPIQTTRGLECQEMGTESPSEVQRLMWMTVILRGVVVNVESSMVIKVRLYFNL